MNLEQNDFTLKPEAYSPLKPLTYNASFLNQSILSYLTINHNKQSWKVFVIKELQHSTLTLFTFISTKLSAKLRVIGIITLSCWLSLAVFPVTRDNEQKTIVKRCFRTTITKYDGTRSTKKFMQQRVKIK